MKNKYLLAQMVLISIVLFASCKSKNEMIKEMTVEITDAEPPILEESADYASKESTSNSNTVNDENVAPIDRKLIKEADLEWETNNIDKTHKNIAQLVKQFGAYVADDDQYKDDYTITNRMLVKVPAQKFDEFLSSLNKDVEKYKRKSIKVIDVTQEYVDVATRIKTKKELEQRYIEILKSAKSVEDILKIESELNTVRTDIETAEARMKVLNHQISLSSIHISFYETTSAPVGFFGKIGKSFVEGWNGTLYFILNVISIWPMLLVLGLLIYFIYRRRKKKA